jgi:DNA-binding NarL/FixJ family response regulator
VVVAPPSPCLCAYVRVLLVDDSPLVRKLVRTQLLREPGASSSDPDGAPATGADLCLLEAGSVAEASVHLRAPRGAEIEAALLDLELGDGTGVEIARELRTVAPSCRIGFFSSATATSLLQEALRWGPVFGKPRELSPAVRWIQEGSPPAARSANPS